MDRSIAPSGFWEDVMWSSSDLRERARRYQQLATVYSDRRTVQALLELAAEYDTTAASIERWEHTRERARQMWEEEGRTHGHHLEHWYAAEHELAEAEYGRARRQA
jgi:hypothetical protein